MENHQSSLIHTHTIELFCCPHTSSFYKGGIASKQSNNINQLFVFRLKQSNNIILKFLLRLKMLQECYALQRNTI